MPLSAASKASVFLKIHVCGGLGALCCCDCDCLCLSVASCAARLLHLQGFVHTVDPGMGLVMVRVPLTHTTLSSELKVRVFFGCSGRWHGEHPPQSSHRRLSLSLLVCVWCDGVVWRVVVGVGCTAIQ